jgi:hypothetical protein
MIKGSSLFLLSGSKWEITTFRRQIYTYQRHKLLIMSTLVVRTYQDTETSVFSLITVLLIAQADFSTYIPYKSFKYLHNSPTYIPGALLTGYGNNGAHQTTV